MLRFGQRMQSRSSAAFSSPTTAMDVNLSRIVFLLLAALSQTYCQSECISYMKYLYAMDIYARRFGCSELDNRHAAILIII